MPVFFHLEAKEKLHSPKGGYVLSVSDTLFFHFWNIICICSYCHLDLFLFAFPVISWHEQTAIHVH